MASPPRGKSLPDKDGHWRFHAKPENLFSAPGGICLAARFMCEETNVDSCQTKNIGEPCKGFSAEQVAAEERGLADRVVAVLGSADCIPLPDGSVDALVSRGSFCFWQDRAQGLREVCRILRPGAKARLGGGLGSRYPNWARREFIRKRLEAVAENGPDAARRFVEDRHPETFRRLAVEVGLSSFEVISSDGLGPGERLTGVGTWPQFVREADHGR